MSKIEEFIANEIPFSIEKIEESTCTCGAKTKRLVRYELKIDVRPHYDHDEPRHRYYAYYVAAPYGTFSRKYIGRSVGFGHSTLLEALQELKRYVEVTGIKKGQNNV